jgi:hypothetical protein
MSPVLGNCLRTTKWADCSTKQRVDESASCKDLRCSEVSHEVHEVINQQDTP